MSFKIALSCCTVLAIVAGIWDTSMSTTGVMIQSTLAFITGLTIPTLVYFLSSCQTLTHHLEKHFHHQPRLHCLEWFPVLKCHNCYTDPNQSTFFTIYMQVWVNLLILLGWGWITVLPRWIYCMIVLYTSLDDLHLLGRSVGVGGDWQEECFSIKSSLSNVTSVHQRKSWWTCKHVRGEMSPLREYFLLIEKSRLTHSIKIFIRFKLRGCGGSHCLWCLEEVLWIKKKGGFWYPDFQLKGIFGEYWNIMKHKIKYQTVLYPFHVKNAKILSKYWIMFVFPSRIVQHSRYQDFCNSDSMVKISIWSRNIWSKRWKVWA